MQYGYGITFEDAKINKALEFLKRFPEDYAEYQEDMRKNAPDDKESNESCLEWLGEYEDKLSNMGLAAFFAEKINEKESIHLVPYDNYVYLPEGLPWDFSQKERILTEEDMNAIFARWVDRLTDDVLDITRVTIYDDCD